MKLTFNPKVLCIVIKCRVEKKKKQANSPNFYHKEYVTIVKRILGLQGLNSNLRKLLSVWDSGKLL